MNEVLVIGHRNPDTDAICSAIGYAEFKQRTDLPNARAARCGDTNERIDFVLRRFGIPAPRFVADVSPKIRDVMQSPVVSVPRQATVAEALTLMDERNVRGLPVLNDDLSCRGVLSLFKISKFFFPSPRGQFDSRRVLASMKTLARILGAETVHVVEPDHEQDLVLMIGAMSRESFAQRLLKYPREKLLVVVGDRQEIQSLAIQEGVRVVVVTGGLAIDPAVIQAARDKRVNLLLSPHDTATTGLLCRAAITVEHMIHEHYLAFREDESLADVRAMATASQFHSFPVVDAQERTIGIITKSDFLKKVERRLILVDHNELSQAVHGADQVEIIEIIDHHRIGSLATAQPILFRNEPVGSTSTIVADCFFREDIELRPAIAGLLLAGLVTDTLNLTSPTATARDAHILARLEAIAGVNATAFTEKLFASGSVLTSKPAEQAISTDCKEYQEGDLTFSVAQIEEIGFDQFWKRKTEVVEALERYRHRQGHYFSGLLVTDVVLQTSLLLLAGAEAFKRQIDYPPIEPGIYELKDVVSRKKQLLPYLTHCLAAVKS